MEGLIAEWNSIRKRKNHKLLDRIQVENSLDRGSIVDRKKTLQHKLDRRILSTRKVRSSRILCQSGLPQVLSPGLIKNDFHARAGCIRCKKNSEISLGGFTTLLWANST